MAVLSALFLLSLGFMPRGASHSWVACTDYRGDMNYYEDEECYGYIRNWQESTFGEDRGRNHQPGNPCDVTLSDGDDYEDFYTTNTPAATYEKGKT